KKAAEEPGEANRGDEKYDQEDIGDRRAEVAHEFAFKNRENRIHLSNEEMEVEKKEIKDRGEFSARDPSLFLPRAGGLFFFLGRRGGSCFRSGGGAAVVHR